MAIGRPYSFGTECAVLETLKRSSTPLESIYIADKACRAWKSTVHALRNLHECGLIHIAGWRPVTIGGGHPAKLWAYGHAPDVQKPHPKDEKECRRASWHRRRSEIVKLYGKRVALKIFKSRNNGGADVVHVDGRVIYRRRAK